MNSKANFWSIAPARLAILATLFASSIVHAGWCGPWLNSKPTKRMLVEIAEQLSESLEPHENYHVVFNKEDREASRQVFGPLKLQNFDENINAALYVDDLQLASAGPSQNFWQDNDLFFIAIEITGAFFGETAVSFDSKVAKRVARQVINNLNKINHSNLTITNSTVTTRNRGRIVMGINEYLVFNISNATSDREYFDANLTVLEALFKTKKEWIDAKGISTYVDPIAQERLKRKTDSHRSLENKRRTRPKTQPY